ncbi:hypothetical protein GCM10027569_92530 [Flindersiella endophytica]
MSPAAGMTTSSVWLPVWVGTSDRSCAIFHGPWVSGRSRHGVPAPNFRKISLIIWFKPDQKLDH